MGAGMTTWTRIADAEEAASLMPAWFAARMMAGRGAYGFLLTTGDVVRVSRVAAIHLAATGVILIDVLLDHAGVPDGVDLAWQHKHFLGAPVPGATLATLNVATVAVAVEFVAAQIVEMADDDTMAAEDVAVVNPSVAVPTSAYAGAPPPEAVPLTTPYY